MRLNDEIITIFYCEAYFENFIQLKMIFCIYQTFKNFSFNFYSKTVRISQIIAVKNYKLKAVDFLFYYFFYKPKKNVNFYLIEGVSFVN